MDAWIAVHFHDAWKCLFFSHSQEKTQFNQIRRVISTLISFSEQMALGAYNSLSFNPSISWPNKTLNFSRSLPQFHLFSLYFKFSLFVSSTFPWYVCRFIFTFPRRIFVSYLFSLETFDFLHERRKEYWKTHFYFLIFEETFIFLMNCFNFKYFQSKFLLFYPLF